MDDVAQELQKIKDAAKLQIELYFSGSDQTRPNSGLMPTCVEIVCQTTNPSHNLKTWVKKYIWSSGRVEKSRISSETLN